MVMVIMMAMVIISLIRKVMTMTRKKNYSRIVQSYRHQKKVFEGKAGWEIDVNLDVCGISCSSASGCKTWKGKPNVIEKKTKKMGIRCWILFIMLHIFLIYLLIYVYTHTHLLRIRWLVYTWTRKNIQRETLRVEAFGNLESSPTSLLYSVCPCNWFNELTDSKVPIYCEVNRHEGVSRHTTVRY